MRSESGKRPESGSTIHWAGSRIGILPVFDIQVFGVSRRKKVGAIAAPNTASPSNAIGTPVITDGKTPRVTRSSAHNGVKGVRISPIRTASPTTAQPPRPS